ncbi:Zn-dependent exopeptidase [Lactarius sanguifluus]|nr:Zn-dependent exopeptidase [Lactarius sanguifluus]
MIIAKLLQTLSVLVVFPHDHPDITANKCLTQSYFGTYGTQSVFIPPESCVNSFAPTADVPNVHLHPDAQLVWLEQAALEQRLLTDHPFSLNTLREYLGLPIDVGENTYGSISGKQQPLGPARDTILHHTATSALLALSHTRVRDLSLILPPTWRIYVLPSKPILPVPEPAIARVRDILANLKFNPEVAKIVSNISIPQIQNDIRFLTGEDGKSGIESRHSFSSGAGVAAEWLKTRFEATGAKCELRPFLSGFAPNVVCRYPSTEDTTETVLRAPGANDDGSGTTGLLSIARTIKRLGVTFRSNVELVAFAGEEQGLYGSRYYAADLREEKKNLTLMPPQLGLPAYIGTPEVTQLVANISAIYSPELVVGFTPACCSDHQSFHYQGFPATQVFERAGPIADPMYHNSGDLSDREGYDFEQLKSIAKVQFATLLHVAGFDLP